MNDDHEHQRRGGEARWNGRTDEEKTDHAKLMTAKAAERRRQERELRVANVQLLAEVREALQGLEALKTELVNLTQRVAA